MTSTLRGGAAALSLAVATMVLASTQPQALSTPDFDLAALIIHGTPENPTGDALFDFFDGEFKHSADGGILYANYLGGPVGLYGAMQAPDTDSEVLADDVPTLELMAPADPSGNVFHINYEFDAHAQTQVVNVFTDANAMANHDSKPSVDKSGGVDCTGTTSCQTDPRTQITTLTYPDGVVAIIQRINNITLVAYKTLGAAVRGEALPAPIPDAPPAPPAPPAVQPGPAAAVQTSPTAPPPSPTPAPVGAPAAPATSTGPRLNVVRPAPNFTPGRSDDSASTSGAGTSLSDKTDKLVNDVLTRVSDTVKGFFDHTATGPGAGRPRPVPTADEP
ncbi:hypothetical protein [Mycobacterium sp. EPa45]|uniref:hypothetical protein n=1 Tax=Mycobacterium sp. EPa45 TaxID=1545728 RepID=UPI0006422C5C|nr:hypothetical protein [Mycobacterium sp. EPa45]AKK26057.1 hypothetical protein AB431_04350 [Mycobacterium sp. EPa45]